MNTLKDLIDALTMLSEFANSSWPTHCEHDVLWINVSPLLVPDDIKDRLDVEYSIFADEGDDCFKSFLFGSA